MKVKLLLNSILCGLLFTVTGCSNISGSSPIVSSSTEGSEINHTTTSTPTTPSADDGSSGVSVESRNSAESQQRNPYEIVMPQCGGAGTAAPNLVVFSQGFVTDLSGGFASKLRQVNDGVEVEIINLNGVETQSSLEGAGTLHNSGVIKIADIPKTGKKNIAMNVLANGQGGNPGGKSFLKDSYQVYEGAQGISPVDYIGYHDFNSDIPGNYEAANKIGSSGCGSIIWHDDNSVYITMLGNDYVKLGVNFT